MPHEAQIAPLLPGIRAQQLEKLLQLRELIAEWNERVNLVSRRDVEALLEHHLLHSLALARFVEWMPGDRVLDFGTGGGLPGIPLAIVYPEVHFHLVDSVGKKVKATADIAARLGLANVTAEQARGETLTGPYVAVVSRAVTDAPQLWRWVRPLIAKGPRAALWLLKGGAFSHEVSPFGSLARLYPLYPLLPWEYYAEKYVVRIRPPA